MQKKDYYEILGIPKNATEQQIKDAYKKLAKEHHPDMVAEADKKAAEERFKEINEAYQVLKDPEKKKMYDRFGHAGFGNTQAGGGGFNDFGGQWGPFTYTYSSGKNNGFGENIDPFEIFEEFFGFRGFGGQRKPRKGKNLYYEMSINFEDAVKGLKKEINIESGKVVINIPKGVRDGTELKFSEKGMPGPNNAPPGDLYITLRVPTPKEFERAGDDLLTVIKINFVQAILGDKVDVPVIDEKSKNGIGTAKLKIPSGTQPNSRFRIKGKGMPRLRGSGNGDVIVHVIVELPKKVSRKQKKLLEEFYNN